ncbi:MAG: hypothetical protein JO125_00420 [Chloroflexi bacterium]|nr:hypothetical protein [Ktedonobacteraceae bacterium]MBV9705856.1 hypothetical protein [Chloroflexota bacterium]
MPVLATEDKIAPKSILRHRPIGDGKTDAITTGAPIVPRASRSRASDTVEEVVEWQKDDQKGVGQNKPAARRVAPPPKSSPTMPRSKKPPLQGHGQQQIHPLLYLGIGMLAMLVLWMALSALFGWFATTLDDLHYGRPRTFQTDAWVGHNEQTGVPSHFIALNLHGRIEVIELPGGDGTRARIYVGPQLYGSGSDLVPVTLSFKDVNGDHKPDMIVHFEGNYVVFINDQGGFRPPQPSEHYSVR